MPQFMLHHKLAGEAIVIGQFSLCQLLLMNNANAPWFVIVPMLPDVREIYELEREDQYRLIDESSLLARAIEHVYAPHKLNIAALGNMVPQLHIHHIARYRDDAGWPGPIWGHLEACAYSDDEVRHIMEKLKGRLGAGFVAIQSVDQ